MRSIAYLYGDDGIDVRVLKEKADKKRGSPTPIAATILILIAAMYIVVGPTQTASAETPCPTSTLASPGFRPYLPDCRAYELVTPAYTEGGAPIDEVSSDFSPAISPDGEHVITGVAGAFGGFGNRPSEFRDGAPAYEFSRSATGWQSTILTPSAAQYPHSDLLAASPADQLESTLWDLQPIRPGGVSAQPLYKEDIYLRRPGGELVEVGPGAAPEVEEEELAFGHQELTFAGASNNLDHVVFAIESQQHNGHSNLWSGDTTTEGDLSLYEYVGTGNAEPTLVGVRNDAPPWKVGASHINEGAQVISDCGTELGAGESSTLGISEDTYNAVSESGEAIFFTAKACSGNPDVNELYARIGGTTTVAISEPTKSDCSECQTVGETTLKDAVFQGASQNGEKVFFLTEQELLPGQKGMTLYEYDFAAPEGERVKLISSGASEPEVQGVVRVAENGERIYFVAKSVLSGANAEGKAPEAEADNLYVYDTVAGEAPLFVATLLTPTEEAQLKESEERERQAIDAEASATREARETEIFEEFFAGRITLEQAEAELAKADEAEDQFITSTMGTRGPSGTLEEDHSLWRQEDRRPAQASPDGRFLVFLDSADLTMGDTSNVPQLFEYDAQSQSVVRVSTGYRERGNVHTFSDAPQIPVQDFEEMDRRTTAQFEVALTSDGRAVFFTSAAELYPGAVSEHASVFEYREGEVYLISDGRDTATAPDGEAAVQLYGIATDTEPSGRDVFFTTADSLVPQASDSAISLYDAREDGGFPAPTIAPGCGGETCRGASAAAPQLGGALSPGQTPGGNLTPKAVVKKGKKTSRAEKLRAALKLCARAKSKRKRSSCRNRARRRYRSKAKVSSRSDRRTHKRHGTRRGK